MWLQISPAGLIEATASCPCAIAQITAYEVEIEKLRRELLKEIGHLEERKEEAVRAAAECSEQQLQSLQQQFTGESPSWESCRGHSGVV